MDAKRIDFRKDRGFALATEQAPKIKHVAGSMWFVPSQTSPTTGYVVDTEEEGGSCSCPDFESSRKRCKHLWAVLYVRQEAEVTDSKNVMSSQFPRLVYSQDWPRYNRAQCEEKERVQLLLRSLCDGIQEPQQGRGRPRIALRDAVYCATMKVYGTLSGRRTTSDLRAYKESGHIERVPSYNSVFRCIERPELLPLFQALVEQSALPLRSVERKLAVDSTGFATATYVRWFDHRYGQPKKIQRWVKAHASVGTHTNIITAVEMTEGSDNDSPMLKPLLERNAKNGYTPSEYSADKAYLSHENLALIESHGAKPFIPFKSNSSSVGSPAWERMYHHFAANNEDFQAHYHRRSNVEATFSAMKRKFGGNVCSKLPHSQYNEVLLKCLCWNLSVLVHAIHELQIDPKFWMPTTLKKEVEE